MDACNLDAGGTRKRLVGGTVVLLAGVGVAAWQIHADHDLWLRIVVALALFGFGALALFQAQART